MTLDELARTKIKAWLHSHEITQTALAARIGKKQAWVSRYLSGEFNADLTTLDRMAGVFDHTFMQLLNVTDDSDEGQIIEAYRALPRKSQRLARELLKTLAHMS